MLARFSLIALLSAVALAAAEEDPAALLAQLNGDDFDIRRSAADKLEALGESARGTLEQAVKSDDPEVRQTALHLLERLQKFVVILAPFDRDGKPLTEAEGTATVAKGENNAETSTHPLTFDKDGKARLVIYPPNPCAVNVAWKNLFSGSENAVPSWGIWFSPGDNPLSFALSRGGTLQATIASTDGKPVKDAHLDLYGGQNYMGSLEQDTLELQLPHWGAAQKIGGSSGDDGKVTIEHVPDGVYQCVIHAEGFAPLLAPRVRIHEGQTTAAPAMTMIPGVNGKIQFTMLQTDGKPVKAKNFEINLQPIFEGPTAVEARRRYGIFSQWNRGRQAGPVSDDKGKVVAENIPPGKYDLTVRSDSIAPQHLGEIVVASGGTVDLGEKKTVTGGNIKGKLTVNGQAQLYSQVFAIPEQTVIDALAENSVVDWRYMRQDYQWSGRTSVQSGSYEIKNLMPGRYCVVVSSQFGVVAYVFGVEIVAGETAQAPDVALSAPSEKTEEIKGSVLMPDGKPAASVPVTLIYETQGQWGNVSNENGVFQFQAQQSAQGKPGRLLIKAPGCKPATVDLKKEQNLQDIHVQLEKQSFGSLTVKVVDAAGAPVSGAAITTTDYAVAKRTTNKNGETTLSGLIAGERTLNATRDGYYLKDGKVVVVPDTDSTVTLMMLPGFVVKGRVELPEGAKKESVSVWLNCAPENRNRVTALQPNGEYLFKGVLPGEYTLNAIAAGFVCRETINLSLTHEQDAQKEIAPINLVMVHATGAAFNVGAEFDGCTATLAPHNHWSEFLPAKQKLGNETGASAIDASGRVEFWGLAPGTYDMLLSPAGQYYRYYGRGKNSAASSIVQNLVIDGVKSAGDLAAAPAPEIKVDPHTAKVSGVLTTDPPTPVYGANGYVTLKVIGTGATGTLTFNFPQDLRAQSTPIQILGKSPEGLAKPRENSGFQIDGLPAGDYAVVADITLYRYRTHRQGGMTWSSSVPDDSKHQPQTLKKFTLKAGEQFDLGTLKFDLSSLANVDLSGNMEIDDHVPEFQP